VREAGGAPPSAESVATVESGVTGASGATRVPRVSGPNLASSRAPTRRPIRCMGASMKRWVRPQHVSRTATNATTSSSSIGTKFSFRVKGTLAYASISAGCSRYTE